MRVKQRKKLNEKEKGAKQSGKVTEATSTPRFSNRTSVCCSRTPLLWLAHGPLEPKAVCHLNASGFVHFSKPRLLFLEPFWMRHGSRHKRQIHSSSDVFTLSFFPLERLVFVGWDTRKRRQSYSLRT